MDNDDDKISGGNNQTRFAEKARERKKERERERERERKRESEKEAFVKKAEQIRRHLFISVSS